MHLTVLWTLVSRILRVLVDAGLAQPGKIERGLRAAACKKHLHQLHVCLPAGVGRTRLLYRMSMDFMAWTKAVPFIDRFWASIANQVGPQGKAVSRLLIEIGFVKLGLDVERTSSEDSFTARGK